MDTLLGCRPFSIRLDPAAGGYAGVSVQGRLCFEVLRNVEGQTQILEYDPVESDRESDPLPTIHAFDAETLSSICLRAEVDVQRVVYLLAARGFTMAPPTCEPASSPIAR